jgi:NADPH-dependent curcumin reductase CurA
VARAKVQGFIIFDYCDRFPEGLDALRKWVAARQLVWREDIVHGLVNAPDTLTSLYRGENKGRLLIEVDLQ